MRTTIVPAQITTVEDMIAGNLNLTQIVLLVSSLFVNTCIYAVLPIQLSFSPLKLVVMGIVFTAFITLSLRIKGRLILNWTVILTAYTLRPHIYTFNKNSLFARNVVILKPVVGKTKKLLVDKLGWEKTLVPHFDYQSILRNQSVKLHFKKDRILVVKTNDQS